MTANRKLLPLVRSTTWITRAENVRVEIFNVLIGIYDGLRLSVLFGDRSSAQVVRNFIRAWWAADS
jgi:hypothetical protein